MRLKDKDKEWLRVEIKAAVEDALTVEMQWRQMRDEKTGLPLAEGEGKVKIEKIFLPSFIASHLKFHEGAFRGSQETIGKASNKVNQLAAKVDELGKGFLTIEKPLTLLTRFCFALAQSGVLERLEDLSTVDTNLLPEGRSANTGGK